jgi:secreted protein with Ig-like and vWFA domain
MSLHINVDLTAADEAEFMDLFETEERREQAMMSGDTTALAKLLADDAIYIHSSAVVDDENSYVLPLQSRQIQYDAIDITVTKLRRLGAGVVLLSGRAVMQTVQNGQSRPLDNLFIMTWIKTADGWRMASWQSTPTKVN